MNVRKAWRSGAGMSAAVERQRVLVLGGSGFVGRYVVARLAAEGHDVVVVTRRREAARHLLLLPTVQVVQADPYEAATLARLVRGTTAVVNLVGVLHERGRQTFERAHVELPRLVIAACSQVGVRRVLHMSALCADENAPSRYLQSKAAGEALIAGSGVAWTIFRPSVIFGREDGFLNLFARLLRVLPVIALAGAHARFQPIYVSDVATCFAHALGDPLTAGKRYDLCGPQVYTLAQLVRYVGEATGNARPVIELSPRLSALQARMMEWLPGPLLTRDNLLSMQRDSVCDCAFPELFGVVPATLEAIATEYLAPGTRHSRFDEFRAHGGR